MYVVHSNDVCIQYLAFHDHGNIFVRLLSIGYIAKSVGVVPCFGGYGFNRYLTELSIFRPPFLVHRYS